MKKENINFNNCLVYVRGIGVCSEHGKKLNQIAKDELNLLIERLRKYTKDEQYYILDELSSQICGVVIDRGEDIEDPEETEDADIL